MNASYAAAIKQYFQMWETSDFAKLDELFTPDCLYAESDGAVYHGLDQIKQWIADKGVTPFPAVWTTHNWFFDGHVAVVTWTFATGASSQDKVDGVSIIAFNRHGQIRRVREFQAIHDRNQPYDDVELHE